MACSRRQRSMFENQINAMLLTSSSSSGESLNSSDIDYQPYNDGRSSSEETHDSRSTMSCGTSRPAKRARSTAQSTWNNSTSECVTTLSSTIKRRHSGLDDCEIRQELSDSSAVVCDSGDSGDEGSDYEPSDHDDSVELEDVVGISEESDSGGEEAGSRARGGRRVPASRSWPRQGTMDALVWSDGSNFQPDSPDFRQSSGGITPEFPCTEESSELDYFCAFFDGAFMDFLCTETNKFYQYTHYNDASPDLWPHMRRWTDVVVSELYVFFALLMLMVHVKKHVLREYWISPDDITATPVFIKFMARDRFASILRYLHFTDNNYPVVGDQLWKIRTVFTMLKERFMKFFRPFQNVVVDEFLVLFRGRFAFRQYIPSKRHRFGTKFFVLCDCESGYVLDLVVYTASDADIPRDDPHGFSGAVVKKLMDRYFGGNHVLYTDNYYTSPALSKFLLEHDTGSCGTVCKNRKHWPVFTGKPARGEVQLKHADKMLAIRWHDKRTVQMMSTMHKGKMVDSGKRDRATGEVVKKPEAVVDYNVNMRLVDKSDMQVGALECVRKCVKWYKKMFLQLMDITILNAYKLYLVKTRKKSSLRVFQKQVISQILEKYGDVVPAVPRRHSQTGLPDRLLALDWVARHYLDDLPSDPSGRKVQRRCYVCKNTTKRPSKRKDVTTWCRECDVGLCKLCFVEYHTKKTF
ncbi:piggyBac transposable element-derived protein 4-like [Homarus americanus]|uniref:piggyBac transposable element-derived protein 4-like n=1 Tax=Homarus americanus TaxID=6706 RepID=UPI001C465DA1|nr:piggyBac transposable element-derived protein 4-like [Homarus americanus]